MQISAIVHLILQLMKYLFSSTNICFWDYRLQEGKVDCSKQLYFSVGGRSRFSVRKGSWFLLILMVWGFMVYDLMNSFQAWKCRNILLCGGTLFLIKKMASDNLSFQNSSLKNGKKHGHIFCAWWIFMSHSLSKEPVFCVLEVVLEKD